MYETSKDRPHYRIDFQIGDIDLTYGVDSISIINSISAIFQLVVINFKTNSLYMIQEKIYGQNDIKLDIALTTENIEDEEVANYELIILSHNIPLPDQDDDSDKNEEPLNHMIEDSITLYTIPKKPLEVMTTTVNKVFQNEISPIETVDKLITKFAPDINKIIKKDNSNREKSEQIMIPPMPMISAIRYIDDTFGIFNGPTFCYSNTDLDEGDSFYLWDLNKAIKRSEEYEVHILDRGSEIYEQVKNTGHTPDKFYTFTVVNSTYHGNRNIAKKAYKHKYVVKPSDRLFQNIDLDMNEIFNKDAITDNPEEFFMNENLKKRMSVHSKNITGLNTSESFARTAMSKNISKNSSITFGLDRHLQLSKLTKVGIPIDVQPMKEDYLPYQGKYIVASSSIYLRREDQAHYIASAMIHAFRANVSR